ncbi:MAG: 1-acyl-sn-glycerol-3-phosphate acyltransferase [Planctomycetes bacterium]|nr:1-acyl-sn-glycerol-3-phosphate acyltransferase [Planctomycetota bacterium]
MTAPPFDPQPGGHLRGALMMIPALTWAFAYMFWMLVLSIVAPRYLRRKKVRMIRRWGMGILKILGIRIEVHGQEHLQVNASRIVLFNHVNVLDLAVLAAVWSEGCSVIYKKEFHKIPIMGRLMAFFGMIPIDRSNRERAVKSMSEAAKMAREQNKKVMVSPEGTRSRDGKLDIFKRGPFHLAMEAGAPVVPFIMRGLETLVSGHIKPPRTGVVRVDILDPISTENWTRKSLDSHVKEVRQIFLQYLPDGTAN